MLWFAWKIVLLQYRKQLAVHSRWQAKGCDLLEKSYFCSIANNFARKGVRGAVVVICLKNRTFAVSQTTGFLSALYVFCCDLLEKSYFCSIANNLKMQACHPRPVVICLKNRTFSVSQTTSKSKLRFDTLLWFAWKIVLLQYRKQPMAQGFTRDMRCDLLEKSYFCSIANNSFFVVIVLNTVVICLKNRTFAVSQTTSRYVGFVCVWLWFAWKIVLLQYRKQQGYARYAPHNSCDLLEKSYFCSIANNGNNDSV